MDCQACGHENPAANRFCGGCGAALARVCPACAHVNPPDHRFCGACAASLATQPARTAEIAEARKVVTVVFADLIGSTSLHERLDAESARRLMDGYYRALHAAIAAHGGTVVKLLGDGVMAAFGVPRVAEDDAIRAVRAAVAIGEAVKGLGVTGLGASPVTPNPLTPNPLSVRVAVNTGEVVVSADNTDVVGDPVNVAARLQQEAPDGEVLIGESTRRLVGELVTLVPFGVFALKGRSEAVAAYRLVSLERPAGAAATAFVGRDDELRRITAVWDAAVAERRARLAVVVGSPGLGKSRLLDELGRRLDDRATALRARCDATGAATFAPIAEALRAFLRRAGGERPATDDESLRMAIAAGLADDADRDRIAAGIGSLLAGTPATPEETFFVVRRFLAALAARQPVVLAIDDLQWAEPLLLDLVEHLVQWGAGVPLLVLAAARPDLRDVRSSLAQPGGLVSEVVTLAGLDAAAATRLAANIIGAEALPAVVAGRVLATSEGNPLFVGELVRMLVDDGVLRQDGDRWTAAVELASLEMPPTIHALLAARIERLGAEDRAVLERAAVVGRQFSRAAVAHLLPADARPHLDTRLEALRRSELIESDTAWFLGEPALRFHHGLTRDAAYRRVLKGTRAELHGRVADWIESRVGETVEHDETIGWHLEQAHQHLGELGPLDAQGRAFGERASRYLAAAGRRALARDDLPVAANLLGRALNRLEAADPARADLALDWCEALLAAGDVGPAAKAIAELGTFIDTPVTPNPLTPNPMATARLRAWHTCFAGQLAVLTDPQALHGTVDAVAAAAAELAAAGDDAGEAKAHLVHALALSRLGKVGVCEAALDRALAAARRVDDRRRANTVLANAPLAALWGPSPVTRASGRCLDVVRVLRITQGAPAVEAVALRCQAVLEALRGRSEAARRMIASARRMVEELGITQQLLEADVFAGFIDLLEGDAVAAERTLRGAYEGLRDHGLGIDAARAAAFLARALLAQGRAAEAEAVSHDSEALAGDDLQAAITWRGVRAEALATRGEHAAAIDFARAAVDLAAATDTLLLHADARRALATALLAGGRGDEAHAEEARAIELWEAKGVTLLAERARGGAPAVGQVDRPSAPPARRARRRLQENAASANAARLGAVIAARDPGALSIVFAEDAEVTDHRVGTTYDREGSLRSWRSLMRTKHAQYGHEPLATLGDSLALYRQSISGSHTTSRTLDVGAWETDNIVLIEIDAHRRRRRSEIFALDRLGDAVVRLYERYAELLPDGPERARAAATARSVAAGAGPIHLERLAAAMAADVEFIDRRPIGLGSARGAPVFRQLVESLIEAAPDTTNRIDDVLGIRPDATLLRITNLGTDRATGGRFERCLLRLSVFGADGLSTRIEQFDADRDAEALARFDALIALPEVRPARRRVRPNAATTTAARVNAAAAARDAKVLFSLHSDRLQFVQHPTGVVFDCQGTLAWWRLFFADREAAFRLEPCAVLGDSLTLTRYTWSGSAANDADFPVGAFARDGFLLMEVDGQGRAESMEEFATDRLADAVIRLYERYAEIQPDGPARDRAVATAHSVVPVRERFDPDRYAAVFAPDIEAVDHRATIGWGSMRGAEAFRKVLRTQLEVAVDIATRVDDIVALRSDAFLVRWTNFGKARVGGGDYERHFLILWAFGPDGLATHIELFDPGHEAEALARFDEVAVEPPKRRPARRRVRANAATAYVARLCAAIAARDADVLPALLADDMEVVHRPSHSVYGREEALRVWRSLIQARHGTLAIEPLAVLGESLALCRHIASASGAAGKMFDFGAYEIGHLSLVEVDERGRERRGEYFSDDRLGDAVARLYERYAELLPDGSARDRAAATARSVAAMLGPFDLERYATALAPAMETVDHRILGTWSGRGAEALLQHYRSWLEVADHVANRFEDVLGLECDALLVRRTNFGTDRAGGGTYERQFLMLWGFGADGHVTRSEVFDADGDAEAMARFDELLTAPPTTTRIENAATRSEERVRDAWAARDWKRFAALFPAGFRSSDRRTMMHLELDRDEILDGIRAIFEMTSSLEATAEVLATRGNRLALTRFCLTGHEEPTGLGPTEVVYLQLLEVDDDGNRVAGVAFDPDDLDAAYAELDERYAAGEATPYTAAVETVQRLQRGIAARDWEELSSVFAPDLVVEDHRPLGSPTLRSRDEYLRSFRALVELAPDVALRVDHVLAAGARGRLAVARWVGSREGGPFETLYVIVVLQKPDGRIGQMHVYDVEQLDAARTLYDERVVSPEQGRRVEGPVAKAPAARIENAATRAGYRLLEAMEARDWERFAALFAAGFRNIDRQRMALVEADRDRYLDAWRPIFETFSSSTVPTDVLATRGDRLVLAQVRWAGSGHSVGPSEFEWLAILEVDANGDLVAEVNFDSDDLDAAYAELDERYVAGEAAPFAAVTRGARAFAAAVAVRDWDALAAVLAPDLVVYDHRPLGWETLRGPAMLVDTWKSLVELAPDARLRLDHVTVSANGSLAVLTILGSHGGGEFEDVRVVVHEYDGNGKIRRHDIYALDQLDEARARFDAIGASAARDPLAALAKPNAAAAARDRAEAAFEARDWSALRSLCAADATCEDRRRHVLVSVDVDGWIAERQRWARSGAHQERRLVGTAGNRVALERVLVSSGPPGGRSELEYLSLTEVDESGRILATVAFDPDDWRAANREGWKRWLAADAVAAAMGPIFEFPEGWNDHDRARVRAALADDLVIHDHRLAGLGLVEGADAYVEALAALWDLAPDIQVESCFVLAREHYGLVSAGRVFGTFPEGGPFESQLVWVFTVAGGRITRIEFFEIEDVSAALARFAELRPDQSTGRDAGQMASDAKDLG